MCFDKDNTFTFKDNSKFIFKYYSVFPGKARIAFFGYAVLNNEVYDTSTVDVEIPKHTAYYFKALSIIAPKLAIKKIIDYIDFYNHSTIVNIVFNDISYGPRIGHIKIKNSMNYSRGLETETVERVINKILIPDHRIQINHYNFKNNQYSLALFIPDKRIINS